MGYYNVSGYAAECLAEGYSNHLAWLAGEIDNGNCPWLEASGKGDEACTGICENCACIREVQAKCTIR